MNGRLKRVLSHALVTGEKDSGREDGMNECECQLLLCSSVFMKDSGKLCVAYGWREHSELSHQATDGIFGSCCIIINMHIQIQRNGLFNK